MNYILLLVSMFMATAVNAQISTPDAIIDTSGQEILFVDSVGEWTQNGMCELEIRMGTIPPYHGDRFVFSMNWWTIDDTSHSGGDQYSTDSLPTATSVWLKIQPGLCYGYNLSRMDYEGNIATPDTVSFIQTESIYFQVDSGCWVTEFDALCAIDSVPISTGISQLYSQQNFTVYPNPSTDGWVHVNKPAIIYDLLGKKITYVEREVHLPSGMYFFINSGTAYKVLVQ